MKKVFLSIALISCYALSGCGDSVPKVEDYDNIVVNGKKMTPTEFFETYCMGEKNAATETCARVQQAARLEIIHRKDRYNSNW